MIKSVMTTHVIINAFEGKRNIIDDVRYISVNFIENMSTLNTIKSYFKSHMIKRILLLWSFHMKFIKHAEGSFNKFHMK